MADIQKEEKVNVFQIVSDVYQDNSFMPKKTKTLDIFGYKIDMFHNFCIIAFFSCFTVFNRGPIVTSYMLFVAFFYCCL